MRLRLMAAVVGVGCALGGAASATPIEDRLRDQLRATVTDLRSQQDSLAAAQAERDALKAQLKAAKGRPVAPARDARMGRDLVEARRAAAEAEASRGQLQAQMDALKASYDQLAVQARDLQADRDRLKSMVAERDDGLSVCRTKNGALLTLSREILDRFQRQGLADVLLRKEPLIGARRVQIENLAQAYGDRLYDQRLDVPPAKSAGPQGPAPRLHP